MPIDLLQDLPENVRRVLGDFLDSAHLALGASLKSVILFGSAAEGRLRATSDVNLLLVLDAFAEDAARQLQPQLEMAYAAIRLRVMLLLESELDSALEAFAQKFADIGRRRRVLYGSDVLAGKHVPRDAAIRRTRQVLLNLALRLRERYALTGSKPEAATAAMADATGPIRTCAAELLELEGLPVSSPKEALIVIAKQWPSHLSYLPAYLSELRERGAPATPAPHSALGHLLEAVSAVRNQMQRVA